MQRRKLCEAEELCMRVRTLIYRHLSRCSTTSTTTTCIHDSRNTSDTHNSGSGEENGDAGGEVIRLVRHLLPCLTILRSFTVNGVHAAVYDIVIRALAQIIQRKSACIENECTHEGTPHLPQANCPPHGNADYSHSRTAATSRAGAPQVGLVPAPPPHSRSTDRAYNDNCDGNRVAAHTPPTRPGSADADTSGAGDVVDTAPGSLSGREGAAPYTPTQPRRPVYWSDICGCEEAIVQLRQAILLPQRFAALFAHTRHTWQRILLYGPPGTGKTLLAHATADEARAALVPVAASDILSKWVGESERAVRQLFAHAARPPHHCVLFLDEVDALGGSRGSAGESEVGRRVKTELMLQMERLPASVTLLAATNLPWEMDSAIRRRFDCSIYVPLPPPRTRWQLFVSQLAHLPAQQTLTRLDVRWLVERTEGFSASDVVQLTRHAMLLPMRALLSATAVRRATSREWQQYRHRCDHARAMMSGWTWQTEKDEEEEEEEGCGVEGSDSRVKYGNEEEEEEVEKGAAFARDRSSSVAMHVCSSNGPVNAGSVASTRHGKSVNDLRTYRLQGDARHANEGEESTDSAAAATVRHEDCSAATMRKRGHMSQRTRVTHRSRRVILRQHSQYLSGSHHLQRTFNEPGSAPSPARASPVKGDAPSTVMNALFTDRSSVTRHAAASARASCHTAVGAAVRPSCQKATAAKKEDEGDMLTGIQARSEAELPSRNTRGARFARCRDTNKTAPEVNSAVATSTSLTLYVPCAADDPDVVRGVRLESLGEDQLLLPPVTRHHFVEALQSSVPSATSEDIARYEQWRQKTRYA